MERKNDSKLLKICITAMFAALICIATMIIRIPSPLGGYINFGDAFIILAAWLLGPVSGFAAGGIGSALADLFAGYAVYVPGTFVIKGLIAVIAAAIYKALSEKGRLSPVLGRIIGAVPAELFMIAGYYLYAAVFMGEGFTVALQSVAGNAVQGIFGVVGSVIIMTALEKSKITSKFRFHMI
ncbi:MAG: ECF transporter S component [Ruminiclostridium sp.]|nr:ECF transporter S component [Ruminiclostridium sp.]